MCLTFGFVAYNSMGEIIERMLIERMEEEAVEAPELAQV